MENIKLTTVRDLVRESSLDGYKEALFDLAIECSLKESDGFIITSSLLEEVTEMLLEKKLKQYNE